MGAIRPAPSARDVTALSEVRHRELLSVPPGFLSSTHCLICLALPCLAPPRPCLGVSLHCSALTARREVRVRKTVHRRGVLACPRSIPSHPLPPLIPFHWLCCSHSHAFAPHGRPIGPPPVALAHAWWCTTARVGTDRLSCAQRCTAGAAPATWPLCRDVVFHLMDKKRITIIQEEIRSNM